ncbi:MAG: NUDIX domain-containing protein [Candidatus Lokiarchaeota archaeon]
MEDEIIACIKKDDLKYLQSGQISKHIFPMERNEAHKKEIPHLIVRVFILRKNESGKFEYLVQKRSERKRVYPGYYTDSASGHILYKEGLNLKDIKQNAIRELNEEFGIAENDLVSLFFYELSSEKNKITTEVAYIFMGTVKTGADLKPNPKEVDPSVSRFYSEDQLIQILNNEKLIDHSKRIWKKLLENKNLHIFNEIDKTKSIKEDNNHLSDF